MLTRSLIKMSNQFVKGSIPPPPDSKTFGHSCTEGLRHSWGNKATNELIRTTTTATATKQFCLSLVNQGSLASLFHHLLPWRFFKLAIGSGFFQARLVLKYPHQYGTIQDLLLKNMISIKLVINNRSQILA